MAYPVFHVPASTTLYVPFASYDKDDGSSITMTGLAVTDIEIYKNGSVTQRSSDAGYTLLDTDGIDFDGVTGIHGFSIDLSDNTDASFYTVGSWYTVVVSSVTVDAVTVNFIAAVFRILPAETTTGYAKADVSHFGGTAGTFASGRPEVTTNAFSAGAITAAALDATVQARLGIVAYGTAQAATGTTLQLASASTFADDELIGAVAVITGGSAGVGQSRVITDYVSSTDTATVDTWTTTPTGTITYVVFAAPPASATVFPGVNVEQINGVTITGDGDASPFDVA
jgi:hypothetical protein